MKSTYIATLVFFACFVLSISVQAQDKRDYIWLFGAQATIPNLPAYGPSRIDFSISSTPFAEDRIMGVRANQASICTKDGKLLFYTNGCMIANGEDELLEGSLINDCGQDSLRGHSSNQGCIFLPHPEDTNRFYLFHQLTEVFSNPLDIYATKQLYTLVDKGLNGGKGGVVESNIPIIEDSLYGGLVTAVKHGNNKDWWMLVPERKNNGYHTLLITSDSIQSFHQRIGVKPDYIGEGSGQATYSPDGSMYARYDKANELMLFDFDRQTGTLSNFRHIDIVDTTYETLNGGVAFSPNSRYLYVSTAFKVWQYDTWAADVKASEVHLATADNYRYSRSWSSLFGMMQLAPDCKIYMANLNSGRHIHVINYPDLPGKACDIRQHSIQMPTLELRSIPNHPHFRLGTGEPVCDTSLHMMNFPPPIVADFDFEIVSEDSLKVEFSPTAPGADHWLWYFGDGNARFKENPTYSYEQEGIYEVCLQAGGTGGMDTVCKEVVLIFTSTSKTEKQELRLFPNPASQELFLQFPISGEFEIIIYDIHGKIVANPIPQFRENNLCQIEIAFLKPGLHFISVIDNQSGQQFSARFVKLE